MNKQIVFVCLFFIFSSLTLSPLHAAPKDELEKTTKALEDARDRQKELVKEQLKIEEELAELQKQLVAAAGVVRGSEDVVSQAEEKLRILREQLDVKSDVLKTRHKDLEALVRAAIRLSQTPPEAMVMLPGKSADTIKAASAMKMIARSVREDIASIQQQMKELEQMEIKIAQRHDDVTRKQARLDKDRAALQQRLDERQALQQKLVKEERQEAQKAVELARKAQDLQALVEKLMQSRKKELKSAPRSIGDAKGKLTLPASGKIIQKYGGSGASADTAKGIVIEAGSKARVVALFDGEVVFTGPFRSYGNMVIMRHGAQHHSLLAGLSKIDVEVGDFLLEGEPIGAMGKGEDEKKLYMELRHQTQPIDPKPWLKH